MKNNFRAVILIGALLLLAGCAATSSPIVLVPDAGGAERISALSINCRKPDGFTQDCSAMSGPTNRIRIADVDMRVAGNETGDEVLLYGPKLMKIDAQSVNLAYEVLKRAIVGTGASVLEVSPVISMGQLVGYVVRVDKSVYAHLDQYRSP